MTDRPTPDVDDPNDERRIDDERKPDARTDEGDENEYEDVPTDEEDEVDEELAEAERRAREEQVKVEDRESEERSGDATDEANQDAHRDDRPFKS